MSDQRRRVAERWPLWLLSAWSFVVNLALLAFLIYIAVQVTEIRPTISPYKYEDTPQEEQKDREDVVFERVVAYIVAIILLGEVFIHVLLFMALILERTLSRAPQFVVAYIAYEILMLVVLCTVLIFDVLSLLHPKSTAEKVVIAIFMIGSLVRRSLSLIVFTKYHSYLKYGEQTVPEANLPVNGRPLGEVEYVDELPKKNQQSSCGHPKRSQEGPREHVPFSISSHYITHEFYDGRG
uniref:Transmembrane protein n=1 Tax=Steinernema glaseri TaxID=37863 RepID=A0A1I8A2N4_9BILA